MEEQSLNNEFLNQLYDLMIAFKEHHNDLYSTVEIVKNSECEFYDEDAQISDFEHGLMENTEYVSQTSVGDCGDYFEGVLMQKIKGTEYCLVMEYST